MRNLLFASLIILLFTLDAQAQLTIKAPNGDVGVGTDTPGEKLDVLGNSNISGKLKSNSFYAGPLDGPNVAGRFSLSGSVAEISLSNRSVSTFVQTPLNGERFVWYSNGTPTDGKLILWSGSNLATFNNTGDFGIGTINPSAKLDVVGDAFKTVGGDLWNVASDKKLKRKIKDFNSGLEYIKKMNVVEFEYNGKAGTLEGEYQIGVIAQELNKVAPFMIHEFQHIESSNDLYSTSTVDFKKDKVENYLSINASAVKWMLVDAVKEHDKLIAEKDEKINQLEQKLNDLILVVEKLKNNQNIISEPNNLINDQKVFISQNFPNPFKDKTTIEYYIPEESKLALIEIINVDGAIIKSVELMNGGLGELNLDIKDLANGIYFYRLVLNGKIAQTRKMSLVK